MSGNVFYVGGSKGGVGKSLFSFALIDYLLEKDRKVLLVDTDTDNPDVYKAHKNRRCNKFSGVIFAITFGSKLWKGVNPDNGYQRN